MFIHFQGGGVGHKVIWDWNKFLEDDGVELALLK